MCKRVTRADQHQSLIRERPLRPVPSSPVRSVSAWSPKPLLVLSSSQTVVHELSQAFRGHQLAFRQEFVSELLHFSILSSQGGTLPFEDFSILLDEIAFLLWSHRNSSCFDLESSQELWNPRAATVTLSSITSGHTRSLPEVVGPSEGTQRNVGAMCYCSGRVVQKLPVAPFLLCRAGRQRRSAATWARVDLAVCRSDGDCSTYSSSDSQQRIRVRATGRRFSTSARFH